jgi:hypothetical protein
MNVKRKIPDHLFFNSPIGCPVKAQPFGRSPSATGLDRASWIGLEKNVRDEKKDFLIPF